MSQPAARVSDMHTCPMQTPMPPPAPPVPHVGGPVLPPGEPTTMIGGLPAARVGDLCTCVGPPDSIVKGSATVMIGGRPAARLGDNTAHGGVIAAGFPKVLIGDSGSGGGAGGAGAGLATAGTARTVPSPGGDGRAQKTALRKAAAHGVPFCEECEKLKRQKEPPRQGAVEPGPQRSALQKAAAKGVPFCEECEKLQRGEGGAAPPTAPPQGPGTRTSIRVAAREGSPFFEG